MFLFYFTNFCKFIARDSKLPEGKNKIFHSSLMGTHSDLNGKENVAVMQFMENESLKLAKRMKFSGILTTNTSPLTQVSI